MNTIVLKSRLDKYGDRQIGSLWERQGDNGSIYILATIGIGNTGAFATTAISLSTGLPWRPPTVDRSIATEGLVQLCKHAKIHIEPVE